MTVDWIDTLLGGNHEFNVPTLTVSSSEIGKLSGNGSVRWNAETGIRIQAVTDGREAVRTGSSNVSWGQLIDPATYCTFAGLTDNGWNFASVPEPRGGLTTSSNLPTVMWDLRVRSIILERQSTRRSGCSLRMLMEPDLPSRVRNTHTTVNSEAFGEQIAIRCDTRSIQNLQSQVFVSKDYSVLLQNIWERLIPLKGLPSTNSLRFG